jgi:hypothetical protein
MQLSLRFWTASAVVVGILAFGTVALLQGRFTGDTLSYAVQGGHLSKGGLIECDSSSSPALRFSDGTEVRVNRESKVALSSVNGRGARVAVVDGSAHVDVVHKPGSSWLIDAGPFLVMVTGTAFTVQWSPVEEQLDLKMERGSVEVSGPLSEGTLSIRSGQHLIVRVRQRETLIQEREDTGASKTPDLGVPGDEPTGTRVAAHAGSAVAAGSSSAPRPSQLAGDRDWSAAVAKSDYQSVIRQAERRGLDATLSEANNTDLAAGMDLPRPAHFDPVLQSARPRPRGWVQHGSLVLGRCPVRRLRGHRANLLTRSRPRCRAEVPQ